LALLLAAVTLGLVGLILTAMYVEANPKRLA
jgi:hypothetical protein